MSKAYEGWAILELMGHRRLGGMVSESLQYGGSMLRIDVHGDDGIVATQFYSVASIYCLTPCSEQAAKTAASLGRPAPIQQWELPALPSAKQHNEYDDDDCPV